MRLLFDRFVSALALAALILVFGGQAAHARSYQVAANTTAVSICTNACTLNQVVTWSKSATIVYLKLYNDVVANVTCGSGTPVERLMIVSSTGGAGAVVPIQGGTAYSKGMTACVTAGIADNDATAPAASSYLYSIFTKP